MSRNDFANSEIKDRDEAKEIAFAPIVGIVVAFAGVAAWFIYWVLRWTQTSLF